MIRSLFMIGNKRSGTSALVRLLNLHPEIFLSHESDIVWILYQLHQGIDFKSHPWDSEKGMRETLELAKDLLNRDESPQENFERVQRHLMETGTPWLKPQVKTDLKWIGDKKPFQLTDPRLFEFVLKHFPGTRFLHLVRHPFEVAASSTQFNLTKNGDFWLGTTFQEKLELWARYERETQRLLHAKGVPALRIRYEDLCRRTEKVIQEIFLFLELEPIPQILKEASRQMRPVYRPYPKLVPPEEVEKIANAYGYAPQERGFKKASIYYWRTLKRLRFGAFTPKES